MGKDYSRMIDDHIEKSNKLLHAMKMGIFPILPRPGTTSKDEEEAWLKALLTATVEFATNITKLAMCEPKRMIAAMEAGFEGMFPGYEPHDKELLNEAARQAIVKGGINPRTCKNPPAWAMRAMEELEAAQSEEYDRDPDDAAIQESEKLMSDLFKSGKD